MPHTGHCSLLRSQERERLKQEKRDEKRLNKERKLELRRLELEMAKELNKPNEDLCLADQKVIICLAHFFIFPGYLGILITLITNLLEGFRTVGPVRKDKMFLTDTMSCL